jgi:hypothetical protein
MADFIARETDLEIVKKLEMEKFEGERDTARE